jgi:membrane associated rhomboid family serine protease
MDLIPSIALIVALVLGILAGGLLRGRPGLPQPGPATIGTAAAVALGLAAQLLLPGVLEHLQREAAAIWQGEVWRLVTSLFVQDGWFWGGLFNLAILVLIGTAAEAFWGWRRWLLIYFGAGILAQLVALNWQPTGGGNSVAVLGLCGSIFVVGLRRTDTRPGTLASAAGVAAGLVLAWLHDIHGAALFIGMGIGLLLMRRDQRRPSP